MGDCDWMMRGLWGGLAIPLSADWLAPPDLAKTPLLVTSVEELWDRFSGPSENLSEERRRIVRTRIASSRLLYLREQPAQEPDCQQNEDKREGQQGNGKQGTHKGELGSRHSACKQSVTALSRSRTARSLCKAEACNALI